MAEHDPQQDEELEGSEDEVEGHMRVGDPDDPGARVGHSDDEDEDEVEGHIRRGYGPEDPDARVG